jgi:hypothetical protein
MVEAREVGKMSENVWVVVWRDGSAIEGVSVYRHEHDAVSAMIDVHGEGDDCGPWFQKDANGDWTAAETEHDAWCNGIPSWIESCAVDWKVGADA